MTNDDIKNPKKPQKYLCQKCDFNTSNKKDYNRHISTPKHQNDDKMMTNDAKKPKKTQKTPKRGCICL